MSTSSRPPSPSTAAHRELDGARADGCEHDGEYRAEEQEEHREQDDEFELETAPTVETPAPEAIAELCAQCVDYVNRSVGLLLDFTPETLPILDHYLSIMRSTSEERPAVLTLVANAAGAYFGELVRQRIDGFWLMPTPDVHDWYVCARTVFLKFNPIGVVHEVIAESANHPGPGGEFKLARDEERVIAERLAAVPPVSAGQYYLLSTRLEAIDIVVETLRFVLNQAGNEQVYEPEDYE
jgi:hypothetical protein